MGTSTTGFALAARLEDVLGCLPVSRTTEYEKGQVVYGPQNISGDFYLVVTGKVGLSLVAGDGKEVLLEIVRPDEVFGESAFLDVSRPLEQAQALETAELMAWAVSDIEDLVTTRPRLAVAMLQTLAQRNTEFTRRIESFALDTIERRLARSLIRFSERMGTPEEDGTVRLMSLTHQLLSNYVGTSREIVTHHMNRLRKLGYVSYSRHYILLRCEELRTLIR